MRTQLTADDVRGLTGISQPRIWTPPRDGMATLAPQATELLGEVGITLMLHQGLALEVALEYDPATGRWTRSTVCILIARQNGKTVLIQGRVLVQLFLADVLADGAPQTILHTAQDRTVARETFLEIAAIVETHPFLSRHLKRNGIRESNGQESIKLRNGSVYRILAPRQSAFRYWSSDLVILDEAREHRNTDVYSAALYTQRAKPGAQMWLTSNAGDADSIVLNNAQDRGRAAAQGNGDEAIGYLEWSGDDDAHTDDVEAWRHANPALGVTVSPLAMLEERIGDDEIAFRTEALCIREPSSGEAAIPPAVWRALATEDLPQLAPKEVRPVFAVDLDPGRQAAALVAVALVDHDGTEVIVAATLETWAGEVVAEDTVAAAVESWAKAFKPRAIGFDPYTTAGVVAKITRINAAILEPVTGVDWYIASGQLWAAAVGGHVRYDPTDTELATQVRQAARTDVGDGSWRITRKNSGQPIPAATALARAVHLLARAHPKAAVFARPEPDTQELASA